MIPIPDGWSAMTSIDKTLHHNLRRVFRLGVGADSLARFEPAVIRHLRVYFSQLTKDVDSGGWSSPADMRKWSTSITKNMLSLAENVLTNGSFIFPDLCLGFDTMADLGLGVKTDLLQSPAREFVLPALHVHERKMGLWEQLPILNDLGIGNLVSYLLLRTSSHARLFAEWYQTFLDQAIADNTTESRGIFGPVIQSGQGVLDKPGHNKAQMIGEASFSTFSSADAYSIMLSGFLHYLSHHPHVYEKLAKDLRVAFRPGEEVVWDARLESSVYLRAVIDEVMRLLPPACGVHWREYEERAGPAVVVGPGGGLPLPVGCDVGMSLFSLFRDGRVFRHPVRFWPERWLPGTLPEEELSQARKMFVPFLLGPRNCAGSHVAIRIASTAFAYVLVNYDFRLGSQQPKASPRVSMNALREPGTESELVFESHYSIAGWETGPFITFKARTSRSC